MSLAPAKHVLGRCEGCGFRCDAKHYLCGRCAALELGDERAMDEQLRNYPGGNWAARWNQENRE